MASGISALLRAMFAATALRTALNRRPGNDAQARTRISRILRNRSGRRTVDVLRVIFDQLQSMPGVLDTQTFLVLEDVDTR